MKKNEIKDLIIKRIDEGGFANQWLYLIVICDSDCSLLLSKRKINREPKYNVGSTIYSDLLLFNYDEMDCIHAFFIEELSKYTCSIEVFYGGLFVDPLSFTIKLRGSLDFHADKGDGKIFELAEIYDRNFRAKGVRLEDMLISKIKLIDELSSIIATSNCEIHEILEINFEGFDVSMVLEYSFRI
jgi:hypothetical protein